MKQPARLLLVLAIVCAACASSPAPPSQADVADIVARDLPGVRVEIAALEPAQDVVRVDATLNGADATLLLRPAEDGSWRVTEIEQGGITHSLERIRRTSETMQRMTALADALEAYRAAQENYPLLDDQLGLRQLVPDYYGPDAPLVDAWGEPFRYRFQQDDYTLTSSGPDRRPGTADDVILVTGRFVGRR